MWFLRAFGAVFGALLAVYVFESLMAYRFFVSLGLI